MSAQDDFFNAPPLSPREAALLDYMRLVRARNDAHDETGSMSEDEERERSERPR